MAWIVEDSILNQGEGGGLFGCSLAVIVATVCILCQITSCLFCVAALLHVHHTVRVRVFVLVIIG